MSSCISAIGTANPGYRTSQNDIYSFMVKAFDLDKTNAFRLRHIYDKSGIDYRYSILPDFGGNTHTGKGLFNSTAGLYPGTAKRMEVYQQKAASLAAKAALNCLKSSAADIVSKITHLITVSCTGMYAPGLDIQLVETLGLKLNVERTCINFMGCYGALNALKTADYICRAEATAKVLVVCVELCTLHFQKDNTLDNWVANSLFSDGAAAALVENRSQTSHMGATLALDAFYSEFIPSAKDEMQWTVGDHGFEMRLSSKVPKLILQHLPAVTNKLLKKACLTLGDIDAYAIHPGGRKILEAAESALAFNRERSTYSYEVLRDYGNMSSASILFVLHKIMQGDSEVEDQRVLAFAFGPGLTVESMTLTRTDNA